MVKYHSNSEREETHCRHMGYSFLLAARVLLCALSHKQDNTYHGLCYASHGSSSSSSSSSKCSFYSNMNLSVLSNFKKEKKKIDEE